MEAQERAISTLRQAESLETARGMEMFPLRARNGSGLIPRDWRELPRLLKSWTSHVSDPLLFLTASTLELEAILDLYVKGFTGSDRKSYPVRIMFHHYH